MNTIVVWVLVTTIQCTGVPETRLFPEPRYSTVEACENAMHSSAFEIGTINGRRCTPSRNCEPRAVTVLKVIP